MPMETFQYTAIKMGDKTKVQGTINAENERHARELLREQELYPTSVKPLKVAKTMDSRRGKGGKDPLSAWLEEKTSKVGLNEKIAFTQNLAMMIKAGIPVTEALLYMESYADNMKFKRLINSVRLDILAGFSFSRALAKQDGIFSETYCSIVQAGEASGELEQVLNRLTEMLLRDAELKKKLSSAMTYPIMVICIVILVVLLMFIFVIPTFAEMFEKMSLKLPLITRVMMGISDFLRNFWYVALGVTTTVTIATMKFISTPLGRRTLDGLLLKLPVVKELVTSVNSSHFISTFQISFSAGLPVTDCLFMSTKTVTHTIIREAYEQVNLQVQAGQRIAASLADTGYLPDMVLIMLSTGEESGSLDTMLQHSLTYLESEVNAKVDIMMSMIEPCLLVSLGTIVGCLALSIYLPLFSLYGEAG